MSDGACALQGVSVFVLEDETLVAMLVEDMIADFGGETPALASRVAEALKLLQDPALKIDVALLDVNVAGEVCFPVAEALAARGTPFAFSSGYGAGNLPEAWRDRPTVQKPYTSADLGAGLLRALGRV